MHKTLLSLCRTIMHLPHPKSMELSVEWLKLQECLASASRMVDLGCGTRPHPLALVGVDAYLEPTHRTFGQGETIEERYPFSNSSSLFVQADISCLPFKSKEFDFAYSHHAFEHVPDPKKACNEICRVAHAGAIITPSIFAEIAFGRPYHLWLVVPRGNTLMFIRKSRQEDRPFGEHPVKIGNRYKTNPRTNPFDILLNENDWYHGFERCPD